MKELIRLRLGAGFIRGTKEIESTVRLKILGLLISIFLMFLDIHAKQA
jgi:hypothetical protein